MSCWSATAFSGSGRTASSPPTSTRKSLTGVWISWSSSSECLGSETSRRKRRRGVAAEETHRPKTSGEKPRTREKKCLADHVQKKNLITAFAGEEILMIAFVGKSVSFICTGGGGEIPPVLLPVAILPALMIYSRLAMCPRGKYQYHVYRLINKQTKPFYKSFPFFNILAVYVSRKLSL